MVTYVRSSPIYTLTDRETIPAYVDLAGTPTPAGPMTYYTGQRIVGDFNGDGRQDFLVPLTRGAQLGTSQTATTPLLFLNDGNGSFANATSALAGGGTYDLYVGLVADFNGDGNDDVIAGGNGLRLSSGTPGEPLFYMLGGTTPTLAPSSYLPSLDATNGSGTGNNVSAYALGKGDVDGDGDIDVLVAPHTSQNNQQPSFLLINDGTGRFTYRSSSDLVTATGGTTTPNGITPKPANILLFDANGDGKADLYAGFDGNTGTSQLGKIVLNDGAGNFTSSRTTLLPAGVYGATNTYVQSSVASDIDADGDLDLVLSQTREVPFFAGRGIQILINDGSGNFTDGSAARLTYVRDRSNETVAYTQPREVGIVDFNRDGFPDLIERASVERQGTGVTLSVYLNDGTGKFTELPRSVTAFEQIWSSTGAGVDPVWIDANGDGNLDIVNSVSTATSANVLTLSLSVHTAQSAYSTGPNGTDPALSGAAGFNEAYYLANNSDIRALVASGSLASGLAHYLSSGEAEGRAPAASHLTVSTSADIVNGTTGGDSVSAGAGDDRLMGFKGADTLNAGAGNDTVYGGIDGDRLDGSVGNDWLDGDAGNDTMYGGEGNDSVRGLNDNDVITGEAGDDDVNGNQGQDTVYGGAGRDVVRGGQGNDVVYGEDGDDAHVNGNIGADTVYGGVGNDAVFGGQNEDLLLGEAGDDTLSGDLGNDTLTGGAGSDRFIMAAGTPGADLITDFNFGEGDRIQLAAGATFTAATVNGNAVLTLSSGGSLTLQGIAADSVDAAWIVSG